MNNLINKRILIVAHGHPDLNKGGAEIAAYNMFKELLARGENVYFLARTALAPHGGAAFSTRNSDREILFHTTHDDWFLFSNIKTRHIWQEFRELLNLIKPDVVHFHHYFLLGVELLQEVKTTLPSCKLLLTLHEYLAICHNQGLMMKTHGKACYKANYRDCHGCFPEKNPGDFFLREKYLKRMFGHVDCFVSPSHFLRERYVAWGLPEDRFHVIENGQTSLPHIPKAQKLDNEPVRFAYFGQINPYKGLDVLLEAYLSLPKKVRQQVIIDIHCANLKDQPTGFQKRIKKLMNEAGPGVKLWGPYEGAELSSLMARTDWVVVPSVWWENSPMVIQEAFAYGKPLIVSNIGGMAEKVEDGVNGIHFRAGSAVDLALVIRRCVANRSLQTELAEGIIRPLSIAECVNRHLILYAS